MTEELKQKAEEYLDNNFCCNFIDECKSGERIRCSAYEERRDLLVTVLAEVTKELQKKVDQLQGYLDHDIEYDIEQKNIELQEENERLKKVEEDYYDFLQKKNEEDWKGDNVVGCLNLRIKQKDSQLTEAKEIIRELSKYVSDSKWYVQNGYVELRKELVAKAEAFINKE